MNEQRAREILRWHIGADGVSLNWPRTGPYIDWPTWEDFHSPSDGDSKVTDRVKLDGTFTPELLEAIAWWMQNMKVASET